jgi:hypothetical protein
VRAKVCADFSYFGKINKEKEHLATLLKKEMLNFPFGAQASLVRKPTWRRA